MNILEDVQKAVKYTSQGDFKSAEKIYIDILKRDSKNDVVLTMLGVLYLNTGYFKSAEYYLKESNSIRPSLVNTENLGFAYFCLGKQDLAAEYFERVIGKSLNFDVYEKYVAYLQRIEENRKAYEVALLAHEKFPLKPEAIAQLADCCIDIGKYKEAHSLASQVTRAYPDFGEGWIVSGMICEIFMRDEAAAKKCYEKALACGEKRKAYYNLAINAGRGGDYDTALKYVKKIYRGPKKDAWLNFTLANLYFKKREFKKAYKYYIERDIQCGPKHPIFKLKRQWDGKKYKQETLLVFCDQGYGDTFMFLRYVPLIKDKFKTVKILIRKEMAGIVKRSFEKYDNIKVCILTKRFPNYDKSVILSHIPYYLKTDIDKIPFSEGYFIPDKKIVSDYKTKFKPDKLKAGICWEAGAAGLRDLIHRTLVVPMFEELFKIKCIQFSSFQVNPIMDDYKKYPELTDLGKSFDDFDKTAGALANLDIFITVDTAAAHLAGALGVKTYLLLPSTADWRWFDNDKKTEWYDSVTIFKQKTPETWDDVFENLKTEILKLTKEN
ncbi:MAG: hypothetical protein K6E29_03430 [Cyanobacteria bacterium RUI128]|nr:hypothetical protein [Cyanobacteria bacterium RUI128]